jgi:hypothetical protein
MGNHFVQIKGYGFPSSANANLNGIFLEAISKPSFGWRNGYCDRSKTVFPFASFVHRRSP